MDCLGLRAKTASILVRRRSLHLHTMHMIGSLDRCPTMCTVYISLWYLTFKHRYQFLAWVYTLIDFKNSCPLVLCILTFFSDLFWPQGDSRWAQVNPQWEQVHFYIDKGSPSWISPLILINFHLFLISLLKAMEERPQKDSKSQGTHPILFI